MFSSDIKKKKKKKKNNDLQKSDISKRKTLGFPHGSNGKKSSYNAGELGSVPGLGISPRKEDGNLFQHFCLENSMDREAWLAAIRGVTKS